METIARLKQQYRAEIPLYAGLELDYYSQVDPKAFDYLLASVHYIIRDGVCYPIDHSPQQQRDCVRDAFHGSVLDMAKCYYDMLTEHVEKNRPAVVGHFDVITKFSYMPEDDPRYREMAAIALEEVVKVCPYIEVNTGAISRGYRTAPYPQMEFLKEFKRCGFGAVITSDCHDKNFLDCHYKESRELLLNAGFNSHWILTNTGFKEVKL